MSFLSLEYNEFGTATEVVQLKEHKLDELKEPGANELIVQILMVPIHPSILGKIKGTYGTKPKSFPALPGNEAVAKVFKVGSGIQHLKPGQRVIVISDDGVWAEYVKLSVFNVIPLPVPDSIPDDQAAQFCINGLTAYIMPLIDLNLKEGDFLIQSASASSVGIAVIQIGLVKGYKTINLVRREEQVKELQAIGAQHVLLYDGKNDNEIIDKVKEITAGKLANGAIDAVGGTTGTLLMNCLGNKGKFLLYGLLSGQLTLNVQAATMLFKGQTIQGWWLQEWVTTKPLDQQIIVFKDLLHLIETKKVNFPVDKVYEFKDYKEAITRSITHGKSGKVLMVPHAK